MSLSTLEDLWVHELKDLYNAENQLVKALPKMAKAASSEELQQAFRDHLEQTKVQVERLDDIFKQLGISPKGKRCQAMEGLLEEGKDTMAMDAEPHVLDAGLIAAAQRVEHYEIAGYGTARTFAQLLGHDEAAELLQKTLDEEKETDELLTELAVNTINVEAADAD